MDWNFYAWEALLAAEREKKYFPALLAAVESAYASDRPVYPPRERLFEALRLTPPENVRCVILGQDPYHEPGQAHGLSFSVPEGIPLPPSLRNIYKELSADLGVEPPRSGDLSHWAEQGVLLLNTGLTVYESAAGSHRGFGWQHFTDAVIRAADTLPQNIVFILSMEIVEARINYLAYAPEIAAVMLRRQQATAIISAREKIVEGAVTGIC